ncbi:MAG: hypothetical protein LBE09_02015 [Christensenellaceae bacterium]|jgi:predicted RNA-binding Zn-ribbon protein involved in translation (DUF1610 family)|nr:hypothetical protein [Christensenellaceae bacterium]
MSDDINTSNPVKSSDTDVAKCPSCGANLVFSPEKGVLECKYCGTQMEFNSNKSSELAIDKLFDSALTWGNDTRVFKCPNCGASEIISKTEISKECAYCGSTNVLESTQISGLKPTAVVPFFLDKDNASSIAVKWAKGRIFAPSAFKKSLSPEGLHGVYTPSFTFDSRTYTEYHGQLYRNERHTRRVNGKTVVETIVVNFNIAGDHNDAFDDILVHASNKIEHKFMQDIEPFDTQNSQAYNDSFIHGFTAWHYDIDGKECWEKGKRIMRAIIKKHILSKYTYDGVNSFEEKTLFDHNKFKYALLPVYVGHTRYKEKLYNFFVNGSTGKTTGKTPLSPIRVTIAVILILALVVFLAVILLNCVGVLSQ